MDVLTGVLTYWGWQKPWEIESRPGHDQAGSDPNVTLDLRDFFWSFAEKHKGALARQDVARDSLALVVDSDAGHAIDFDTRGGGILISGRTVFGFVNVTAYLGLTLQALNSRHVIVTVGDDRFHIRADPDHMNVPEVKYGPYASGNMCTVPDSYLKDVCKAGAGLDCCVFLVAGAYGFECAKFSGSLADHLVERKMLGTMHAGRIGNCRCTGRHEKKEGAK